MDKITQSLDVIDDALEMFIGVRLNKRGRKN